MFFLLFFRVRRSVIVQWKGMEIIFFIESLLFVILTLRNYFLILLYIMENSRFPSLIFDMVQTAQREEAITE